MDFYEAIKVRRSRYSIADSSPISNKRIEQILSDSMKYTPSAFHSQSSRTMLLFGTRHKRLWDIVHETLKATVPPENFAPTEAKLAAFRAGYGSILYFEDMSTVHRLQAEFPSYAENFPIWSMQSGGMLQFAVWTALSLEGLGASLQHYNPIIDSAVRIEYGIPESWKLLAQMPFGSPTAPPDELTYDPIDDSRLIVLGE